MKLDKALDGFVERMQPDVAQGKGLSKQEIEARALDTLETELAAVQASATRWRVLTVLALVGSAAATYFGTSAAAEAAGIAGAGGLTAALLTISRRKFVADLCVALLKAAPDAAQRVKIVEALRDRL